MKTYRILLPSLAVFLGALLSVPAQDKGTVASGPVQDTREELREQSIYVPYDKLWEVFEKKGRGVFLPYEEFMRLWRAADQRLPRPTAIEPPVESLITEVIGEATVSQDVVAFKAHITIELLKKGWHKVPIRLGNVAITKAVIGDQPARLVQAEDGYHVLLHKETDKQESIRVSIEFARAYAKTPGRNSVSFQCPLAAVSRWDVRIPEAGVKVDIHPLLAATDVPPEDAAEQTRVLAFVGATPEVRIDWTPKAEGARGLKALANVKAEHQMSIDEGVVRNRVNLAFEISRAEVSELSVETPAGHKVVNVFDPNVREWSVVDAGDVQVIEVQLFEPVKGSQSLVVELERFSGETSIALPVVKALNVGRQQGVVLVRVGGGLRAEASAREGLLRMDAEELPGPLAKGGWESSYRYAALPYVLTLDVEKVQPRILADSLVEAHLAPEALTLDLTTICDIQRAGVFRIELRIPPDFEVRRVEGVAHGDAAAMQVESHHLDDKTGRLAVNLSRKALGKAGLTVKLYRKLQEPDLLAPTGKTATIPISVPRAKVEAVERESGRLVVFGPESLRVNPAEASGLRPLSFAEASRNMPAGRFGRIERPVLSYAFSDQEATLTLSVERRSPQVTVRQLLIARIESGVVKYDATFFHEVLYSGVKSLRIDVPEKAAGRIRIVTPDVRNTAMEEKLEDLAAGYVAWRIEGETEFLGSSAVRMRWEEKIDELDIGKSVELSLPRLIPRGVDRAWGQVVLTKAEAIDVTPTGERKGLRPIEPRHDLMAGANVADAARAFEFHAPWELSVKATRYEPKDVKATSIERGLVRMVVTRSDVTSVQAVYRMRSARQRLVIELPGNVSFDTQPLRVNGRPVSLEQGEEGQYYVPLVTLEQDTPFLLELRYVVTGAGLSLAGPAFPMEPAVQQVYMSVYVPKDRVYMGAIGPWTDEMVWVLRGFSTWPRGNKSGEHLLQWVTEGLDVDRESLGNFPTDGLHLLFSTLRPASGRAGVLRIMATRTWLFQALVLGLIIGFGATLINTRLTTRGLAAGIAVIALVLLAVFTPSLARSVVNNASVAAGFIVLVVWVLWFSLVMLPRNPEWQEWRRKRSDARGPQRPPPPLPTAAPPAGAPKNALAGSEVGKGGERRE